MSLLTSAKQQFDRLLPHGPPAEQSSRQEAWRRMETLGLPGRKTETWKYISLAPLEKRAWDLGQRGVASLSPEWNKRLSLWAKDFDVAVQVNGRYQPHLSQVDPAVKISMAGLAAFSGEDGFASLSLAVAEPGMRVEVAAGVKPARALLILRFQESSGWVSTCNEIAVGDGASLRVAEMFAGAEAPYLRTQLMAVRLGAKAELTWVRRQNESPQSFHFNDTHVRLAADSRLHFTQLSSGGQWSRGQMRVDLTGANGEAHVQGLTFAGGEQHFDQRIVLNHTHGSTTSSQLFKGVFRDSAKGALNGKIYIARDAQKVSSMQMNHNLLLSSQAEANTKPELEIYADDVKANHGATVGRLDEEKMFYLRSRGMKAADAERVLSEAFVKDVFMKIPDADLRRFTEAGYGA